MRKTIEVLAIAVRAAAALSVGMPAFASSSSCDAEHGAPGGFGPDSAYYTVAGPQGGIGGQTFGARQGVVTGRNNSGYSATCNG